MRTYSAWNEVNHVSQPTYRKPKLAAGYYDVLRADARARKFTVMAADVLDTSQRRAPTCARSMRRAKGRPRLWGLHNYRTSTASQSQGHAARCSKTVPGEVWLTETGGIVTLRRPRLQDSAAARRRAHEVHVPARGPVRTRKRAGCKSKITRLYVYTWFGEPRGARVRRRAREPGRLAAQGVPIVARTPRAPYKRPPAS